MTQIKVPTPENGIYYTAQEVVQILERAKALGVLFIKIQGFEATWGIEQPKREPAPPAREESPAPLSHQRGWEDREGPRRAAELCPDCGGEMIPSKRGSGVYCVPCFIARKEAKAARGGRR